jgi:hypothetical protein
MSIGSIRQAFQPWLKPTGTGTMQRMWRIHFTADDLVRTRVAPSLGPLAETLFGLVLARSTWRAPAAMLGWRDRTRRRLTPAMKPLADTAPHGTVGLDLWTLTGEAPTIEEGLAALERMRPQAVHAELTGLAAQTRLPARIWRLADQEGGARRELATAAAVAYRTLLEPHWSRVATYLETARSVYAGVQLEGGIEQLLARICADARWEAPVLYVPSVSDVDLRLDGTGLTFVPSLFLGSGPVLLFNQAQSGPPRLVFPVARGATSLPVFSAGQSSSVLGELLGRTRAKVLVAIGAGCTTTELARRTTVSLAAASQHATVLRRSGLVETVREGSAVRHVLTPLGTSLLRQNGHGH